MVRINFFTFIIACFILNAKAKYKIKTQETALATLQNVTLESNGKLEKNGQFNYSCKADVQQLQATSSQEIAANDIKLTCLINNQNLKADIQNAAILPYIHNANNHYFFDASNIAMQFGDEILGKINLLAKNCTTNTQTREIILYDCSGKYFHSNQLLNNTVFFSNKPIKIKQMQLYANDMAIKNDILDINAQTLQCNLNNKINAKNISGMIYDFQIIINKFELENDIATAFNIELIHSDVKIKTQFAKAKNNTIIDAKKIELKHEEITLTAEKGLERDKKLLLNNIKFKTKNFNGFSHPTYHYIIAFIGKLAEERAVDCF